MAPTATVTAVGATLGDELFTTEAGRAVAATSGVDMRNDRINEGAGLHGQAVTGSRTLTTLPFFSNFTTPSISAKRVSSPPRLTF